MTTPQTVQIPGTEVHQLHSDAVGDEFEISIAQPALVDGPVGVVYLTDANGGIGTGIETVRGLMMASEIPPLLVVGIGYPSGGDPAQWLRLRTRDFSPSSDPQQEPGIAEWSGQSEIESGGASAFLDFLTRELQPWVRDRYDVTDDSVYIGDSMGGLFGTYALFHRPGGFRRYVLGSPWLCWNAPESTGYESRYAAEHDDLDATVFLAAGADEDVLPPGMPEPIQPLFRDADTVGHTRRLAEALEGRNYPSLRFSCRIIAEETHFTFPPILIAHGLRAVYADYRDAV